MGPAVGGSSGACGAFAPVATVFTGTLAAFTGAHSSYATGLPTWMPDGREEVRTFRFRLSLRDDPAAEGRTATFGFTWESRGD